jgi:hypothetical protein
MNKSQVRPIIDVTSYYEGKAAMTEALDACVYTSAPGLAEVFKDHVIV